MSPSSLRVRDNGCCPLVANNRSDVGYLHHSQTMRCPSLCPSDVAANMNENDIWRSGTFTAVHRLLFLCIKQAKYSHYYGTVKSKPSYKLRLPFKKKKKKKKRKRRRKKRDSSPLLLVCIKLILPSPVLDNGHSVLLCWWWWWWWWWCV